MLRIWSWNVNGLGVWDQLTSNHVDIALLQETPRPPSVWTGTVAPESADEWRIAGWRKRVRTAVVQISDTVGVKPWPEATFESWKQGSLVVSRLGTLAAAEVIVGNEPITLVSMYAAWNSPVDSNRPIYADAQAHRLLSDLAQFITTERSHRVIAAGDLNILNRYGENGNRYWGARYASVFDRAEAMGLHFVGPQAQNSRQASPRPRELPEGSLDVPTFHTRQQGPMGAARQLDFVFASKALVDRLTVRALNADDEEWGASDHCRIAIELRP
jgi:exonuclease III